MRLCQLLLVVIAGCCVACRPQIEPLRPATCADQAARIDSEKLLGKAETVLTNDPHLANTLLDRGLAELTNYDAKNEIDDTGMSLILATHEFESHGDFTGAARARARTLRERLQNYDLVHPRRLNCRLGV